MFIVRDIVHRVGLHHEKMKFNRNQSNATSTLHEIQEGLRKSIKEARIELYEADCIQSMADGIQYKEGYRIPASHEENLEKRWLESRAIASIEPSYIVEANAVVTSITNKNIQRTTDVTPPTDLQRRRSSSKITDSTDNEIAIDMIHLNGNGNRNCALANTHFDESTAHDNLCNVDSASTISSCQQQQQQQQNDTNMYSNTAGGGDSSHLASEEFQRHRSEDIDSETNNPWGELRPENFHDADLWSRERAMSIAENDESIECVDEKSNNSNLKQNVKALAAQSHSSNGVRVVYSQDNVRVICIFM